MEASNTPPNDTPTADTPTNESANVQEGAGTAGAQVPQIDHAPQTNEEVQALADAFAEYRKEVVALRRELAAHRKQPTQVYAVTETPEERANARLELIAQHSHYCPGCGALGKYPQPCTGPDERPHAKIEMVTTDELGGDPQDHTRAPSTDPDQLAA